MTLKPIFLAIFCSAAIALAQKDPQTFNVEIANSPESLVPYEMHTLEAFLINYDVLESLIRRKKSGVFAPGIAESWSFENSGKSILIKIRSEVHFSDGSEVTTKEVVNNLKGVLRASLNQGFLNLIGISDFLNHKTDEISGIEVIDKKNFRLQFRSIAFNVLDDLASLHFGVCKNDPKSPIGCIGTGAYKVTNYSKNPLLINLEENPYWKTKRKLRYKKISYTDNHGKNAHISYRSDSPLKEFVTYAPPKTYYLAFNLAHKNFHSWSIREHIAAHFPIELANKHIGKQMHPPASFIPYSLPGHQKNNNFTPKSTLRNHPKNLNLELATSHTEIKKLGEAVANHWNKNGLNVRHQHYSPSEMNRLNQMGKLQMVLTSVMPVFPSTEDILSIFHSRSKLNYFTKHLEESPLKRKIDSLFLKATSQHNPRDAHKLYSEIDQNILGHRLALPIAYGIEQRIYLNKGINLPKLGFLGPFSFRLSKL